MTKNRTRNSDDSTLHFLDCDQKRAAPCHVKMAAPDKASLILNELGYPVNPKLLRRWAKEEKIPSCWTGKRLLLSIAAVIDFMENGNSRNANFSNE